jgi:4-hydroxybenzoate polyprenyltransferase
MRLLKAFLKLVRWPNLLFIAITQSVFYFSFIFFSISGINNPQILLKPKLFVLLALASIFIAAAGYIINDYFDLNIDKVNKPGDIIVERLIKRRWAIIWHLILSALGLLLSIYVSYAIGNWLLALMNLLSIILLWFYSTSFKRKLLIGNVLISLLTAWVVLVLYFCEIRFYFVFNRQTEEYRKYIKLLFKVAVLYGGFAFIISIIREVIKDLEDIQGDERYGCRTMPIVWGVPASKVFIATWLVVILAALTIVQFYAIQMHWWWAAAYCLVFIMVPLLFVFRDLRKASGPKDYHQMSSRVKMIMLTGILSMLAFKLYT